MDLELTPEQARGSFQCQAGNLKSGFQGRTIIFFDRDDYNYTPAAVSMSGKGAKRLFCISFCNEKILKIP